MVVLTRVLFDKYGCDLAMCVSVYFFVAPTRVRLNNYRRDLVIRTCVLVVLTCVRLDDYRCDLAMYVGSLVLTHVRRDDWRCDLLCTCVLRSG